MSQASNEFPEEPDRQEWGHRVHDLRKTHRLSQVELAERVSERLGHKVEQTVISRIELGKQLPSEQMRIALARVLNSSVGWLFPYPPDVR
jgi:transcriptional regulator with XRE-family HTH domain